MITVDEKLVAVYGTQLANPGRWGDQKYVTRIYLRFPSTNLLASFSIVQLSFVIINSSQNVPTTKVYSKFQPHVYNCAIYKEILTAATGKFGGPTEKFDFSWALVAASSYTLQPRKPPPPFMLVSLLTTYAAGQGPSFLQAIGFSRVLDKAGLPGGY